MIILSLSRHARLGMAYHATAGRLTLRHEDPAQRETWQSPQLISKKMLEFAFNEIFTKVQLYYKV